MWEEIPLELNREAFKSGETHTHMRKRCLWDQYPGWWTISLFLLLSQVSLQFGLEDTTRAMFLFTPRANIQHAQEHTELELEDTITVLAKTRPLNKEFNSPC